MALGADGVTARQRARLLEMLVAVGALEQLVDLVLVVEHFSLKTS